MASSGLLSPVPPLVPGAVIDTIVAAPLAGPDGEGIDGSGEGEESEGGNDLHRDSC